jgi:general secretion pathway protein J
MSPARPDQNRSAQAGFTLIEMLVTLGLLALMSLLVFTTLRTGSAVWARNQQRSDATEQVAVVQSLLRTIIESAYPAFVQRSDGIQSIAFSGTPTSLELSAALPDEAALGGYQRIRIARDDADGKSRLVMAWRLERNTLPFEDLPGDPAASELMTDVRDLKFSYYGKPAGAEGADWRDTWIDQLAFPRLIRITLGFADATRQWPPLLVAPRVEVDSTCVLDLLTKTCRGR